MGRKKEIDMTEALRRVRLIVPMMRQDVSTAVLSSVVLNAADRTIPKGLAGTYTPFELVYLAGQNALSLKLAMDLARIFDLSKSERAHPPEAQDKASVPVLAALLSRQDVQADLVQNSGERRKAIDDFLALAQRLTAEGSEERTALVRIREFRDRRLAHSLFDKEPDALPIYADLDLLLEVAKKAAELACLAVEGRNVDFDASSQEERTRADRYYAYVLYGLKREARNLPPDDAFRT